MSEQVVRKYNKEDIARLVSIMKQHEGEHGLTPENKRMLDFLENAARYDRVHMVFTCDIP